MSCLAPSAVALLLVAASPFHQDALAQPNAPARPATPPSGQDGSSSAQGAPAAEPSRSPAAKVPDAEAAGDAEPIRLLILDLQTDAANQPAAELLSSLLAEMASQASGIEVNTSQDLRRLMALEAEKAALGCDAESCLGEIAGAFGVPYIVFGKITKLGPVTTLSLSLFDAEAARPIWRKNLRAPDAVELQYELADGAEELLAVLAERQPTIKVGAIEGPARIDGAPATADATTASSADEADGLPWLLISGGALAGAGVVGVVAFSVGALVLSEVVLPSTKDGTVRTMGYYGGWTAVLLAAVSGIVVGGGAALAGASLVME